MKNKQSQSLLDLINILPKDIIMHRPSPINNHEATALFDIWKGEKDEYGKFVVPKKISKVTVNQLNSLGLVTSNLRGNTVDITRKGRSIIKNIVLHSEISSFEKKAGEEVNYEKIHEAVIMGPQSKQAKIASKINTKKTNWLQRAV